MMNDLLHTQYLLMAGLTQDPLQALAVLTCWLDPLWANATDWDDWDYDSVSPLYLALNICRHCFPNLYIDAVMARHAHATDRQLETLLCAGFTREGFEIDHLEHLWFGIPLPAYGIDFADNAFATTHPQVIPILALFGVKDPEDISQDVTHLAVMLCHALSQLATATSLALRDCLSWVFGISGNSCVDWNEESMNDYEAMGWYPDNVRLAQAMIQEADALMTSALRGLTLLAESSLSHAWLQKNITQCQQLYAKHHPTGAHIAYESLCQLADRLDLDGAALGTSLD